FMKYHDIHVGVREQFAAAKTAHSKQLGLREDWRDGSLKGLDNQCINRLGQSAMQRSGSARSEEFLLNPAPGAAHPQLFPRPRSGVRSIRRPLQEFSIP